MEQLRRLDGEEEGGTRRRRGMRTDPNKEGRGTAGSRRLRKDCKGVDERHMLLAEDKPQLPGGHMPEGEEAGWTPWSGEGA